MNLDWTGTHFLVSIILVSVYMLYTSDAAVGPHQYSIGVHK